jgi:hypothetical protein
VQAQQLASGTLASGARIDELRTHLADALARQGDAIGPALMGLELGLARIPDKALIRRLVSEFDRALSGSPGGLVRPCQRGLWG